MSRKVHNFRIMSLFRNESMIIRSISIYMQIPRQFRDRIQISAGPATTVNEASVVMQRTMPIIKLQRSGLFRRQQVAIIYSMPSLERSFESTSSAFSSRTITPLHTSPKPSPPLLPHHMYTSISETPDPFKVWDSPRTPHDASIADCASIA